MLKKCISKDWKFGYEKTWEKTTFADVDLPHDYQIKLPRLGKEGDMVTVSVGSAQHPMEPQHYIEWVCIESDDGFQYKRLSPNTPPKANFLLSKGDSVKAVYAFCNQHSLWKA